MADNPKPTGLGILVDEKRVNDLLTQKNGAKAVVRSGCKLLLFIFFLILFTLLALSEPLADFRAFEGFIRTRFDSQAPMKMSGVKSTSSFWEYVDKSFMPGIYGADTRKYFYPDYTPDRLLEMDGGNRLFGVGRIRMLRVKPSETGCKVKKEWKTNFPKCYGPFLEEAIDKKSYGPPDKRTGDPVFNYMSTPGDYVGGKLGSYPPGGFMEVFTTNYNNTLTTINLLKDGGWLGPGTRAVVLDFSIYNFNVMYQAVCRMTFEVDASGRWVSTFDIEVLMPRHLNPIASRSTGDWGALLGEIILVLFVLFYLLEEASEFIGFRKRWPYIKWDYFFDPWNTLDWLNLLLMVATLGLRMDTWGKASGLAVYVGDPSKQSLATFMDVGPVAANIKTVHNLIAFNTVLTWFKAVKYIAVLPYITTFMETVSRSKRQLFSFLAVFFALLFGFVLAYWVAFGEQLAAFRTLWSSFVFLSSSLLGNSDMSLVYNHAPLLGSLLIYLFVIAMFFVSVNLFYAIMISALGDLRQEEGNNAKKWEQQVAKANDFWKAVSQSFRLEQRFRTMVPGLYSRMKARKRRMEEKEQERDEECLKRERFRKVAERVDLGAGNPSLGRRRRISNATVNEQDIESESDTGSDVDLGPLRNKAQLRKGGEFRDFLNDGEAEAAENESDSQMLGGDDEDDGERDEKGIQLVIEATRHVVDGLVDRAYGARGVLVGEMSQSRDVLQKVGLVLEVLQTRTKDLELCQRQLLKHF